MSSSQTKLGDPDDTETDNQATTTEEAPNTSSSQSDEGNHRESFSTAVNGDSFDEWKAESEWRDNVQDGTAFFNHPGYVKPDNRISPYTIKTCLRKVQYQSENAAAEDTMPDGILWQGSMFEENIILPYLRDVANTLEDGGRFGSNLYVQNDCNVKYTVSRKGKQDITISGSTDPVLVDNNGEALLPTEVKQKRSLDKFKGDNPAGPDIHHKAQLHAYMEGLNRNSDHNITKGLLIYGCRTDHDLHVFEIDFDPDFWAEVKEWMETLVTNREDNTLAPAEPELGWECGFCDYQSRCGGENNSQTETPDGVPEFNDTGVSGLVPLTSYPESPLLEYLEERAAANKETKVTPTVAVEHPHLITPHGEYDVYDWHCRECDGQYGFGQFNWDGDMANPPHCPDCESTTGNKFPMTGPDPADQ